MGSRDDGQPSPRHQPLLSSLIVRPSDSGGSDDGGGGVSGGREYVSTNVRRDPLPPYPRSDRHSDDLGYRTHAGSISPARWRNSERRYSPGFDHPPHGRDFESRRETGRFRDRSPAYEIGRTGSRPRTHGLNGPVLPYRGEVTRGNNPNVRPREGDWYCPDPACNNLNFARREHCNNCNRPRPVRGGPGGYTGLQPPYHSPRRSNVPPMDHSPPRFLNGYRSPPRHWARDRRNPRDFVPDPLPPPRHDYPPRRDRLNSLEDEYRGRDRFERAVPPDWGHGERIQEGLFSERKGYERQVMPLSPPPQPPHLPVPHDRWGRVARERSRSPIGGPPKGYERDLFMDRGRDDRRGGGGRDRTGRTY